MFPKEKSFSEKAKDIFNKKQDAINLECNEVLEPSSSYEHLFNLGADRRFNKPRS